MSVASCLLFLREIGRELKRATPYRARDPSLDYKLLKVLASARSQEQILVIRLFCTFSILLRSIGTIGCKLLTTRPQPDINKDGETRSVK